MKKIKYMAIALLVLCLMPVGAKAKTICEYEYTAYSQGHFADTSGFTAKYRAERKYKIKINVGSSFGKDYTLVTYEKFYDNNGTEGDAAKIPDSGNISAEDFDALVQKGLDTGEVTFSQVSYESLSNGRCPNYAMVTRDGNVCFGATSEDCDTSGLVVNSPNVVNKKENYDKNDTSKEQIGEETFDKSTDGSDPLATVSCGNSIEFPAAIPRIVHLTVEFSKYGIPVVLIIYGMIDFFKATVSQKADDMTKFKSKFIKRIIIAVIIFCSVAIIQLFFAFLSNADKSDSVDSDSIEKCLNCFVNGCG